MLGCKFMFMGLVAMGLRVRSTQINAVELAPARAVQLRKLVALRRERNSPHLNYACAYLENKQISHSEMLIRTAKLN